MPTKRAVLQGLALSTAVFASSASLANSDEADLTTEQNSDWQHETRVGYVSEFRCEKFSSGCVHDSPLPQLVQSGHGDGFSYEASMKLDSMYADGGSTDKKGLRLHTLNMSYNGWDNTEITAGLLSPYIFGNYEATVKQGAFPLTVLDDSLQQAQGYTGLSLVRGFNISDNTALSLEASAGEKLRSVNQYWDEQDDINDNIEEGHGHFYGVGLTHKTASLNYDIGIQGAQNALGRENTEYRNLLFVNVKPNNADWKFISEVGNKENCVSVTCESKTFYTAILGYEFVADKETNEVISVSTGFNDNAQAIELASIVPFSDNKSCHYSISTSFRRGEGVDKVGGSWAVSCNLK